MSELIDGLSNEIRRVDGSHELGAGALAEALEPWITAWTRAVEQERDEWRGHAALWRTRAETGKQMLADLDAAVLALADEWEQPFPSPEYPDAAYRQAATELRTLVSDPTALNRVRQEAVEAALAPVEALATTEGMSRALYRHSGLREDLIHLLTVAAASTVEATLAAARDAVGENHD